MNLQALHYQDDADWMDVIQIVSCRLLCKLVTCQIEVIKKRSAFKFFLPFVV